MHSNIKDIRVRTKEKKCFQNIQILCSFCILVLYLVLIFLFYQYYLSKLNVNTIMNLNKEPVLVIYNKVPNCGSKTLVHLLRRLAVRNGFNIEVSDNKNNELMTNEMESFYAWVLSKVYPNWSYFQNTIFVRNFFFISFGQQLTHKVFYINLIRDPIARFVSAFYESRKHFKSRLNNTFIGVTPEQYEILKARIKEEWIRENVFDCPLSPIDMKKLSNASKHPEYFEDDSRNVCLVPKSKYIIVDPDSISSLSNNSRLWIDRSLADCVHLNDTECMDIVTNNEHFSSKQDILINRVAGKENLFENDPKMSPPIYSSGPIPYFSGVRIAQDSRALYNYTEEAINNLDDYYSVVAILEYMEISLAVLENKLPQFFRGASQEYKHMTDYQLAVDKTREELYSTVDNNTLILLRHRLKDEYTLYDYATRKLSKQYDDISTTSFNSRFDE